MLTDPGSCHTGHHRLEFATAPKFLRDYGHPLTALACVQFTMLAEMTSDTHVGEDPPLLAPRRQPDRDYHAALALIGRPGVLTFHDLPEGTSHDARAELDKARRFQLAIRLFEAFGKMRLAGFNPVTPAFADLHNTGSVSQQVRP